MRSPNRSTRPPHARLAVEHDDHIAEGGGVLIEQPPPGGDMDGLADSVQDDLVPRSEQLNAADAGDDGQIKINSKLPDRLDDADRGVVEGRIAPHQETNRAAVVRPRRR